MDDVLIRTAADKDIPMILALLYELGRPKPQNDSDFDMFRKLVKNYVTDSDKSVFLAEIESC